MDPADLQVIMSHHPFDPAADVRITHTVHQGRARDNHTRGLILNQYLRGPSVGKGQHGTVYKCWDLVQNNLEVAIKVVPRHNPRADRLNQLKRKRIPRSGPHLPVTDNLGSQEYKIKKEIAIMKLCRHPHVVRLLEVIDDKLYQKVYMVMEFLGGGEIKWRDSEGNPVLRVDQSRRICRDVILGLEYLHFQGIIHRDIKPANLMWTSDRRTVKISDFGVAHISAAQRLAGSGKCQPESLPAKPDSDTDLQLLFDDSELCKTAGTPSFLAPEVVFDFGTEIPQLSSDALALGESNSTAILQAPAPHRPPITKAIDVWALGVTLYCLLFGRTPFRVESNHEFALYGVICTQDWDVEQFMGLDRIPTKTRRHDCPKDKPCSEGAEIIRLLERLLEKDMGKRITLDEVKRHRWFLRDIPDHERWVRETVPDSKVVATITEDAISDAVSPLRFRWRQRLTNRLTSLLRTVRPQRSFRSADGHSDSDEVGVRSMPTASMSRYSSRRDSSRHERTTQSRPHPTKTSGKSREITTRSRPRGGDGHRSTASGSHQPRRSVADISSSPRSKSSDTRVPASSSGTKVDKSLGRRRGSASLLAGSERPAASVHSLSPTTDEPRPRSRFSLSSLRWRRSDQPTPTSASASAAASVPTTPPIVSREPSRTVQSLDGSLVGPILVAGDPALAMRASSWGDVGEYGRFRHLHEVASIHSGAGDHDEPLDPDVVVVGAGGVATGPLPPTPSASAGVLSAGGLAPPYVTPAEVLCHVAQPLPPPSTTGSASRGSHGSGFGAATSAMGSRWYSPPHAPRSLMQLSSSYSSEVLGSGEGVGNGVGEGDDDDDDASDGDSDSFFARNSEEAPRPRVVGPDVPRAVFRHHGNDDDDWEYGAPERSAGAGRGKVVYGVEEEDDDDDDDASDGDSDGAPIEVRRRRPSWTVHDDDGDDGDDDDDDDDDGGPPPESESGDDGP